MNARSVVCALLALFFLAFAFIGCDNFFVNTNTTTAFPVYAANSGAGSVSAFRLDPGSGALTQVTGSPFSSGTGPNALGTNSSGTFLYAATGGGVSAWVVNSDGTLSAVTGTPFQSGTAFSSLAVDPSLRFVFGGVSATSNIQGFTVASNTGVLTAIAGVTVTTGTPQRMTEDGAGKFLFVAEGNSGIDVFTISTGGTLTLAQNTPLTGAADVAITPNGKFAYVTDGSGVEAYTVDSATGNLTLITGSPFTAGTTPSGVTVDPGGKYVFVANAGSNDVSAYTLDAGTGALTAVSGSPFAAGTGPVAVAVEPGDRFVYVANKTAGSLSLYSIDSATPGKLNSNGTIATGVSPNDVLVVP